MKYQPVLDLSIQETSKCNQEDCSWMETASEVEVGINILGFTERSKGLKSSIIGRM